MLDVSLCPCIVLIGEYLIQVTHMAGVEGLLCLRFGFHHGLQVGCHKKIANVLKPGFSLFFRAGS